MNSNLQAQEADNCPSLHQGQRVLVGELGSPLEVEVGEGSPREGVSSLRPGAIHPYPKQTFVEPKHL